MKNKSVPVFVILYCVLSRNSYLGAVVPQSLFFIYGLLKSGILDKEDDGKERQNILAGGVVCFFGFAVSCAVILLLGGETMLSYIIFALTSFGIYLSLYSVLILMAEKGKPPGRIRRLCVLCSIFPCFSGISENAVISFGAAAAIILVASVLFCLCIFQRR